MVRVRRVLYVQYTNPAAYPPLVNSAQMLLREGWEILFLGLKAQGTAAMALEESAGLRVKLLLPSKAGWRQRVNYLRFCVWVAYWTVRWRPRWIYASDPFSCPAALLASYVPGVKVIYHEHDSPNDRDVNRFARLCLTARRRLEARSALCVLPNEQRVQHFRQVVGGGGRVLCVWNCPLRDEAQAISDLPEHEDLRLYYHGTIVPARLPATILDALARLPSSVKLSVVGYETIGHIGYVEELRARARRLGIEERVEFFAPMPRASLMRLARSADIGLALLPLETQDVNESAMTGASNKPFDYMACNMALLVSDLSAWREMFVEPGYALACDPADASSIAAAVEWYVEHRCAVRAMGVSGRERIKSDWNYETQFRPVLATMLGEG